RWPDELAPLDPPGARDAPSPDPLTLPRARTDKLDRPNFIVMTAVGPDKKGLVNAIAREIHEAGANLEDSRMAILGGEFALLLLVAGPRPALERLCRATPELEQRLGLSIVSKWTERLAPSSPFLPYELKV